MNIVSFLLGALSGVIIMVIISCINAYKQIKIELELRKQITNDLKELAVRASKDELQEGE